MKALIVGIVLLLLLFTSCKQQDIIVAQAKDPHRFNTENRIELVCVDKGVDDMLIPRGQVLLIYGDRDTILSDCQACKSISPESFKMYEIPKDALSSVGGWWAGSGDFFYVKKNHDELEVFVGWQDEMQEDLDRYPFHWEKKHVFTLK